MDGLSERDKAVLRCIFDPTATFAEGVNDEDIIIEQDQEPEDDNYKESRSLCAQGVQLAEQGQHAEALELLSRGVVVAPERAAAYNDRAQLLRILQRDEDAMADIEKVLALTEGKKGRSRAQALCQKGVLLRKLGKDEEAKQFFDEAAELGSAFAKKQMVELNGFAALCNQMLSQVMRGEKQIHL